jgi:hypothetical protein
MGAEGMVDALKQILPFLAAGGRLIDIHPNGDPPPLQVRLGDVTRLVGWVREESDYESYLLADAALATAVQRGWYHWQVRETFAFTTYFDTVADLRTYLAAEWSDAYIEDLVAMEIESLLQTAVPDKEIILEEIVRIGHLSPL